MRKKKEEIDTTTFMYDIDITLIYDDDYVNLICHDNTQIIDSGISFYITSWCDFFIVYASGDFGNVRIEHGVTRTVDMEDICLEIWIRHQLLLKNVRYVLDIHLHLISIGILYDGEYHCHFGEEE